MDLDTFWRVGSDITFPWYRGGAGLSGCLNLEVGEGVLTETGTEDCLALASAGLLLDPMHSADLNSLE